MLLHCCAWDIFVKTHTVVTKRFSLQTFCRPGNKQTKSSRRRRACFPVMYLLNSKFPPGFISADAKTLEVLPTQAHKDGLFLPVYGTNPFITSAAHCERSEGGLLRLGDRKQAPWYGPLYSDPTVLCLLTQPGRRRTCLPSLGHGGGRAQAAEE